MKKYRVVVYEFEDHGNSKPATLPFITEALTPWDAVRIWAGEIEAEEMS